MSQLLHDLQCRLLTRIGTGGIGKSRLAIELADQNQNLFPGGICFVSLASINSPTFLVPATSWRWLPALSMLAAGLIAVGAALGKIR